VSSASVAPRLLRGGGSFQSELRAEVAKILDARTRRIGRVRFFSKAAFMLLWTAASYAYLVFFAGSWWQAGLE